MASPSDGDPDGTHFTLQGPGGPVDDNALYELYAYPADPRQWVRGNAIISLDGGATTDGTSGGLGGTGDRRLFNVLRELADVVVVGAGTARAENYSGAQMTVAQRRNRQQRGQSEIPPIALVTRSGRLDHDLPVLTRTEVPPLVLTCAAAAGDARSPAGRGRRGDRLFRRRPRPGRPGPRAGGPRRARPAPHAVRGRPQPDGHLPGRRACSTRCA